MSVEIAVIAGMIMILCGRLRGRFYEHSKVWLLLYVPSLVFAWGVAAVVREPLYAFLGPFEFELWFITLSYILLVLVLGYLSVRITESATRDEDVERSRDRWNRKSELTHVARALEPTIESLKGDIDDMVASAEDRTNAMIQAAQADSQNSNREIQEKIWRLDDTARNLAEKADAIKKTPDIIDDILEEEKKITRYLGCIETNQTNLHRETEGRNERDCRGADACNANGLLGV